MARKFQIKRGAKANLPTLAQGEFAMTTDSGSEALWLGTGSKNRKIPLDPAAADVGAVNKAGDTMTGNLFVEKASPILSLKDTVAGGETRAVYAGNVYAVQAVNVSGEYSTRRQLSLYNSAGQARVADAIQLFDIVGGENKAYTVLHTGNKPGGSYTGNGDATARTVETGGIGNALFIRGGTLAAIITTNGGFAWDTSSGSTKTFATTVVKFTNGVLTLATDSFYLNSNGIAYAYRVL